MRNYKDQLGTGCLELAGENEVNQVVTDAGSEESEGAGHNELSNYLSEDDLCASQSIRTLMPVLGNMHDSAFLLLLLDGFEEVHDCFIFEICGCVFMEVSFKLVLFHNLEDASVAEDLRIHILPIDIWLEDSPKCWLQLTDKVVIERACTDRSGQLHVGVWYGVLLVVECLLHNHRGIAKGLCGVAEAL